MDPVRLHAKTSELGAVTQERELHTSRTDRVSISVVACEIVQFKIKTQVILRRTIERGGIQVAYPLTEKVDRKDREAWQTRVAFGSAN